MLPGPVTMFAGAHSSVPYANIATAWAPPTAYTSSTPSSAQAARIVGCGRPPAGSPGKAGFCGGDASAMDSTPASWAGTTFITTEDGYTERPPGAYRPTRSTGTHFSVTVPPGTTWVVCSLRRWLRCTIRARRMDSSRAARTAGSNCSRAALTACSGTRTCESSTPSNFRAYSISAAVPR